MYSVILYNQHEIKVVKVGNYRDIQLILGGAYDLDEIGDFLISTLADDNSECVKINGKPYGKTIIAGFVNNELCSISEEELGYFSQSTDIAISD